MGRSPSWEDLAKGQPSEGILQDGFPFQPRIGWQKQSAVCLAKQLLSENVWPRLLEQERAMLLSQQGPMASVPLVSFPTDRISKFEPQPFRILLLRRLRLRLPLCVRSCWCGRRSSRRPWPIVQRARQQGFWARRGWALQSVTARVCREAGARVWTNVFVRDMDIASFDNLDGQQLEVVADGLPVHGGAQVAIDTTMVSPLHSNGVDRRGASVKKGLALEAARKRKEMTYPELAGEGGRARLAAFRSCTVPVLLGLGQDSRPPRGVARSRCADMDQSLEQTTELCCSEGFRSVVVGFGLQCFRWADAFCA